MNKNLAYSITSICLLLAAFFIYRFTAGTGSAGLSGIDADSKIWVKCKNTTCEAAREMGERDFYAAVQESAAPGQRSTPGLPCDQCGKASLYQAKKCPESTAWPYSFTAVPRTTFRTVVTNAK